ncbi:nucleoside diphosphate-linked moiety X motif 17-like isoform X2 [Panulirus ornatus]|uniref:nucleoside diphosphate-linked moiety X motif 17-like isoform X2 n=1 Tax=Panulirus ornatus TaxID=150431 RepID=UPI003A83C186
MASAKYARVLVYLRRTSHGAYQLAKFDECILDHLGLAGDDFIKCSLDNNRLLLQKADENEDESATLGTAVKPTSYRVMHPPFCPIHHLDKEGSEALPEDIKTRGVDVGVAVLLESSDKRLLLTRRPAHMRTFPGTWVPPGGHIEDGESLVDAVLRELEEETGLVVTEEERQSCHILGLWESVFPPLLSLGHPKRHHVVIYLHMVLERSSEKLQNQLKLCPEEVDAAMWLSVDLVKLAVWKRGNITEQEQDSGQGEPSWEEDIGITIVNHEGEHAAGTVEASVLRESLKASDLSSQRVSTGSRRDYVVGLSDHLQLW